MDIIDVQIPGKHVNTLTSASKLINEHFFKNQHQKDIEEYELDWPVPTQDVKVNPSDEAFQKELKDFEKNSDRLAAEKRLKKNQAIDGSVFIKAEWEGSGGEMPPAASKTIFSMGKLHKNRHEFDKKAVVSKLLDVNDPRNVDIMNSV